MIWINIKDKLPIDTTIKYIVETKTMCGNIHRLETRFNGKLFGVRNQIVLRWLLE
jgi:hypothetical protein